MIQFFPVQDASLNEDEKKQKVIPDILPQNPFARQTICQANLPDIYLFIFQRRTLQIREKAIFGQPKRFKATLIAAKLLKILGQKETFNISKMTEAWWSCF